jgi:flagellar FliL protein
MATDDTTPASGPPPRKSRRRIWLLAAIAVIALGGGGAGMYWMNGQAAPAHEEEETGPPSVVPLEPFVVNLADPGGSRFLRVTLSLVVIPEASAAELSEPVTKTRVRSAILELLAQQSADALITPEGKAALKQSIVAQAVAVATHLRITDVFFSEFIVQF